MIELIVNGARIVFPKNSQLVREFETGIFDRELKATDFTYPTDLPMDDIVKRALDNPHIIANPNLKREYPAQLIVDALFVSEVTLRIIKTSLLNNTISISLIGDYGSFGRVVGNKKVNELLLDGERIIGTVDSSPVTFDWARNGVHPVDNISGRITYYGCDTMTHMKGVLFGSITADYTFPMCIDLGENLPVIHDKVELPGTIVSYYDVYDYHRNILNPYFHHAPYDSYRDAVLEYIYLSLGINAYSNIPVVITRDRQFWVPMFKYHYILRKCFEESGFTVSGDAFTNPQFLEKICYNTHAINRVRITDEGLTTVTTPAPPTGGGTSQRYDCTITHDGTKIIPSEHMPDITIIDFLAEVGKLFNLQYIINYSAGTVEVRQLNDLVPNGNVIDLSGKAEPKPDVNFEDDKFNLGFQFAFTDDDANPVREDNVKDDISEYPLYDIVRNYGDLAGLTGMISRNAVYVKSENAYYVYGDGEWDFYSYNLGKFKTGNSDNLQEINCTIVPAPMDKFMGLCMTDDPYGAPVNGYGYFYGYLLPYSNIGVTGRGLLGIRPPKNNSLNGDSYFKDGVGIFNLITQAPKSYNPVILNYHGRQKNVNGSADLYPFASNTVYNAEGDHVDSCGFNVISWNTPLIEGLYADFWFEFVQKLAAAVQVDYNVLLDAVTYSNLNLNQNYIKIDSLLYLCKKANIPFPFPSLAKLSLVRL